MPTALRRKAPGAPRLASSELRRAADAMLAALELSHAELSVLLSNDAGIRALNRAHRQVDAPTDVLAFPLEASLRRLKQAAAPLLGDVVISLDTAARQARARRRPLADEVVFLLAHGLLHLVGHDHARPDEKRRMGRETRRLVRAARLGRPAGSPRGGSVRLRPPRALGSE